jgi:hypothetical protein
VTCGVLVCAVAGGCVSHKTTPRPGEFVARRGDEIVVCGQFVHTGAPVVTWMDPGGYDAYRVERRFSAYGDAGWQPTTRAVKEIESPNRYGLRFARSLTTITATCRCTSCWTWTARSTRRWT